MKFVGLIVTTMFLQSTAVLAVPRSFTISPAQPYHIDNRYSQGFSIIADGLHEYLSRAEEQKITLNAIKAYVHFSLQSATGYRPSFSCVVQTGNLDVDIEIDSTASNGSGRTKIDKIKVGTGKLDFVRDPAPNGTQGEGMTIRIMGPGILRIQSCAVSWVR